MKKLRFCSTSLKPQTNNILTRLPTMLLHVMETIYRTSMIFPKFFAVNSVTYDHIDPSIYMVITCLGNDSGTALCDFVIFPPRWLSTDPETFRPPWFPPKLHNGHQLGLLDIRKVRRQEDSPG
jgi:homogentisate 1,2-dioxygenase